MTAAQCFARARSECSRLSVDGSFFDTLVGEIDGRRKDNYLLLTSLLFLGSKRLPLAYHDFCVSVVGETRNDFEDMVNFSMKRASSLGLNILRVEATSCPDNGGFRCPDLAGETNSSTVATAAAQADVIWIGDPFVLASSAINQIRTARQDAVCASGKEHNSAIWLVTGVAGWDLIVDELSRDFPCIMLDMHREVRGGDLHDTVATASMGVDALQRGDNALLGHVLDSCTFCTSIDGAPCDGLLVVPNELCADEVNARTNSSGLRCNNIHIFHAVDEVWEGNGRGTTRASPDVTGKLSSRLRCPHVINLAVGDQVEVLASLDNPRIQRGTVGNVMFIDPAQRYVILLIVETGTFGELGVNTCVIPCGVNLGRISLGGPSFATRKSVPVRHVMARPIGVLSPWYGGTMTLFLKCSDPKWWITDAEQLVRIFSTVADLANLWVCVEGLQKTCAIEWLIRSVNRVPYYRGDGCNMPRNDVTSVPFSRGGLTPDSALCPLSSQKGNYLFLLDDPSDLSDSSIGYAESAKSVFASLDDEHGPGVRINTIVELQGAETYGTCTLYAGGGVPLGVVCDWLVECSEYVTREHAEVSTAHTVRVAMSALGKFCYNVHVYRVA